MKFLNLLCAVFVLLLTIGCCAPAHETKIQATIQPTTEQNLINYLENSTVILLDNDLEPYCGGVWISADYILTAKHCVQAMVPEAQASYPTLAGRFVQFRTKTEFSVASEEWHYAVVVAASITRDLALVKSLDSPIHSIVTLRNSKLHNGEQLHIIGHTNGLEYTYMPGVVSHVRRTRLAGEVQKLIQVFSGVYLGNSGGGAFDTQGNLVGIASFITPKVPNMSFFVHAEEIANFLFLELPSR